MRTGYDPPLTAARPGRAFRQSVGRWHTLIENGRLIRSNVDVGIETVPHFAERVVMTPRYSRSVSSRRAYQRPAC